MLWAFIHIYFLAEFDDKLSVMSKWGWSYLTRGRRPWPKMWTAPPAAQTEPAAAEPALQVAVGA